MAEMRVFSAVELEFLQGHPSIIWEAGMPVFYRYIPSVIHGVTEIERFDVYPTFSIR